MALIEAPCYFCTKVAPAEALNCPSCGKERKELGDLRMQCRAVWIASGLGFLVVGGGLFYGHPNKLEQLLLLIAMVCMPFVNLYTLHIRTRYKSISGKKMFGW